MRGNLRKRFGIEGGAGAAEGARDEHARLASELGADVGKAVHAATTLGLGVVENVSLAVMEALSPSHKGAAAGTRRHVGSLLATAREKLPDVSGETAKTLTELAVKGGFRVLRGVHRMAKNARRPD